ncbi:MAG: hypothetical protein H6Q06_1891 [Acidobacteria bacterium]|nr:hypothetical protein [Acidobacteriota bacterium]
MTDRTIDRDDCALALKERSGWFAAGDSFRQALLTLSDGAFKLFAHLCLEADRRTGRYEADQSDLARRIGKSRRIVGKYVEELEQKGVCTIQRGRNQYARTCFEIRDQYWPYRRAHDLGSNAGHERNAFVDAIRDSFVSLGCTTGKFSSRDACLAGDWQQRGIPLAVAQDALLMGACRKYSSWFNSGPTAPIGSLAYFESLIAEMQERPLPAGYDTYLRMKIVQLAGAWAKKAVKPLGKGGCRDRGCPEIVQ